MTGIGIFGDIQNSIAPYVGGVTAAGWILGAIVIIVSIVCMEFVLSGTKTKDRSGDNSFLVSATMGYIISVGIGWIDPWTVIFIALVLGVILVNPFSSRRE